MKTYEHQGDFMESKKHEQMQRKAAACHAGKEKIIRHMCAY